ncbi:MAG: putative exported protein [Pseudomonadota bacterium]|jgi:pilus assembly protein FimV
MFSYKKTLLSAVLLSTLLLQPSVMLAAALGEISVQSAIGQRLSAEIEIVGLSKNDADTISLRLAPPEAYKEAGLDYSSLLRSLRFNIEKKSERYIVRLSSEEVVNDPFITILFQIDTDGNRTIRQYALLLDPPAVDQQVAVTEPQTAVVPDLEAAVVPANTATDVTTTTTPTQAAPSAEVAATHTVSKGETLHGIATQLKPADTKLEQVLIALQRLNPNALNGGNINRMKAGSVLTLPDADTIKAIDANDARKLVNAQTADFRRYREQLANYARKPDVAAEARSDETNNRQSQGRIGVQVTEPTGNVTQDKLRLSKAGAVGNTQSAANDAANMDKIAAEKALAEANDRVAALEKNVRDMSSLLDMKNQTLAAMQSQNKSAAVATPTEPTSTTAPVTETQAVEKTEVKAEVKTEAEPASQTVVQLVEEKIKTDPLVTEMKTWKWDSAQFFNQDTAAYASAAAVVLLSLAFISSVVRRRRYPTNVYDANPFLNERKTKAQSELEIKSATTTANMESKNSVFHSNFVPSVSQLDTNEVDPVAEADAYIAYGRDKQAEEILLDALRSHPQRHILRVKLLEIHAGRQDKKKFATLATELQSMTKAKGAEWEQAMRIGRILDPDNPLYSAAKPTVRATQTAIARSGQETLIRNEPSLKLVVSDTTVSKSSSVMEFDSRLEGMLAAHRKREIADGIPPIIDAETHIGLDFPSEANHTKIRAEIVINDDRALTALRTKLDLALACQEIGDRDGARELLSEVASAENPELAKRAKSLLAQLA